MTTDSLDITGGQVFIGAFGSGASTSFRLAELIAVHGTVTDTPVAGIETYLKAKYKLTF